MVDSESEDEDDNMESADKVDDDDDDNSVYSDDTETSDIEDSHEEASDENRNCDSNKVETIEDVDTCESSPEEDSKDASKELVWRLAYSGQDTSTHIRDLVPSCQYQLRVCAINSAGNSDYSCNVSMEMPASAPASPHSLSMASSTCSSLCVKWKRSSDHGEPIRNYVVEWGPSEKDLTTVTTERKRITLNDLRPDTSYLIRVQAENAKGKGQFSSFLKVSTQPLPPAPPKLECLTVSHNQLKLRWGDSKISLGTHYILETENSRRQMQQIYSGNNHSYKVTKLNENTEYRSELKTELISNGKIVLFRDSFYILTLFLYLYQ